MTRFTWCVHEALRLALTAAIVGALAAFLWRV
jgi:hypothetical protein